MNKKNLLALLLLFIPSSVAFASPTPVPEIKFDTPAAQIVGGATSFSIRNNADTADNLLILDDGSVTFRSGLAPAAANGSDLGTSSLYWRNIYVEGKIIPNADLTVRADGDSNREQIFGASSDTDIYYKFGDGGITAAQTLSILSTTSDADDDAYVCIGGGGACSRTRGGYIIANGNEVPSLGGNVDIGTGDHAGDTIYLYQGASVIATVDINGISLSQSGDTLALQEATAGAKCMGELTFNGTTAVTTATTCATTGSRIFLTPTSDPSGATAAYCWVTNIVNGVSFDVDCDQANDGTANWLILHESS